MKKLVSLMNNDIIQETFWRIFFVMMLAELINSLSSLIDGIILARYLGSYAIGAHGLSVPYTNLVRIIGGFFATGTLVVCSDKVGQNDLEGANHFFSLEFMAAMIVTVIGGILITTFSDSFASVFGAYKDPVHLLEPTSSYLYGLGFSMPFAVGTMMLIPIVALNGDKARIGIATYIMMVFKIGGDLLNVFVFHGGMTGMGLATTASYLAGFIVLFLHFRKRTGICFRFKGRVKRTEFLSAARAGILPAFTRTCSFIRSYWLNLIYLTYAGTDFLSANSLVQNNVKVVFIVIVSAIGQAVLTMTGVLYGEEDKRGLERMLRADIAMSLGPLVIIAVLSYILAPQIVALFGGVNYSDLAVQAFRVFTFGFPLIGIKMFYIDYFQGSRNVRMSVISSALGETLLLCVSSLVLVRMFGTFGLMLAYPVSELLYMAVILITCIIRNGHLPRNLEELLLLPDHFDVPKEDKMDITVYSIKEVTEMSETARQFCISHGVPKDKSYYVSLAVEEMAVNIFRHGFALDNRRHFVDLKIIRRDNMTKLRIRDDCAAFNPSERMKDMITDDPNNGIGLRLILGLEERNSSIKIHYTNILNLNNFIMEVED